jgi:hypothetical protein
MTDLIERDTVTDGGVAEAPNANLADRQRSLDSFMQAVFVSATRPGEVLAKDSLRLLQLWPHKAWLLASNTGLPGALDDFSDIMTDIGHGFCEFRLAGEQALDFLGSYTSANPAAPARSPFTTTSPT